MYIEYGWEINKDSYDLREFRKAIRKEIRKVLKPVRDYIKASAREGNSKI